MNKPSKIAKKRAYKGLTTRILHAPAAQEDKQGAVHSAIQPSVTYTYRTTEELIAAFQGTLQADHPGGFTYARSNSPTVNTLERRINALEQGVDTLCTATGMAAILLPILALLREKDHVIASKYLFGNTVSLFNTLKRLGIELDCVDVTDIKEVEAKLKPNTRLLFFETISNPLTYIPDLENIQNLAKAHQMITIVDNTLTTPYFFKPKELGFTFAHHSLTKYLGGHAAALGGSITDLGTMDWENDPNILDFYKSTPSSSATAVAPSSSVAHSNPSSSVVHSKPSSSSSSSDLLASLASADQAASRQKSLAMQQIRKKGMRDMGSTLAAESAATLALGLETFVLRMERIGANVEKIALFLEKHPKIARVYHPSLPSHPHHERMKKWFACTAPCVTEPSARPENNESHQPKSHPRSLYGGSGILSFELKPEYDMLKMTNALNVFRRATHLGDTRSLVIPMAPTIFFESGLKQRQYLGIGENLVRLSIGIEEIEDLLTDLSDALQIL